MSGSVGVWSFHDSAPSSAAVRNWLCSMRARLGLAAVGWSASVSQVDLVEATDEVHAVDGQGWIVESVIDEVLVHKSQAIQDDHR